MANRGFADSLSTDIVLSLWWAGRTRTLRLPPWIGVVVLGVVPLLAGWYLCATVYVVFHDQLLASLLARQSDLQYSYEDRIAALKTQLDRETSRGFVDRHTLETTLRDLGERGARLEARAATIDTLLTDERGRQGAHGPSRREVDSSQPATPPSALPDPSSSPGLRLDGSPGGGAIDKTDLDHQVRIVPSDGAAAADLSMRFASLEKRQTRVVSALREPAMRAIERMRAALRDTGLPIGRNPAHVDVGGPFVPLDAGHADFGQSIDLLRDVAAEFVRVGDLVDKVPLRKPFEGPLEVTSTFGARLDPFYGRPAMHTGIDLRENYGDKVEATAAGVVTIAGPDGGYGNMVEIDHGNGLSTRYAHLSSLDVSVHQHVAAGQIVGRVGSTGRATGPHLHYETRIGGEPVDPARFLRAGANLFQD